MSCPNCKCGKQIPGQDGVAKQEKLDKSRREKAQKMFPKLVTLGLCPKCNKYRVEKLKEYEFCLACDYSTLRKIKVSKNTRKYLNDLDKFEKESRKSMSKDKRKVK